MSDEEKPKTSFQWTPDAIQFYVEKFHEVTSRYEHLRAGEFVELLVESCMAERELHDGLVAFLTQIKQQGLEIETDQQKMQTDIEKLSRLRFYRKMIFALGLTQWEDELMRLEIQRIMMPGSASVQVPMPRKGPK